MKCDCIVAWHHGHSGYTAKSYKVSKKSDNLDCCGGTELANYCYRCGRRIKIKEMKK